MSENNPKKYAIVPVDVLKDLQKSQDLHETTGVAEKLISLDNEMENILKLDGISQMEKAEKYADILTKFLEFKRQHIYTKTKNSIPTGVTDIPVEDAKVDTQPDETISKSILSGEKDAYNSEVKKEIKPASFMNISQETNKEVKKKPHSKIYKIDLPSGWIDF